MDGQTGIGPSFSRPKESRTTLSSLSTLTYKANSFGYTNNKKSLNELEKQHRGDKL